MTVYGRNKKGQYSDQKSRSKEDWERGKGAKKKGNPSYKKNANNHYVVRKDENDNMFDKIVRRVNKIRM